MTMRQLHAAGHKLFVDYAGDGVPVVTDRLTGGRRSAQIFVAVLHALGRHGMAKAFADIEAGGDVASLGRAEWRALLLEREASLRRDKRLSKRLQYAKLRQQACVEDIDYRAPRGLDRSPAASKRRIVNRTVEGAVPTRRAGSPSRPTSI